MKKEERKVQAQRVRQSKERRKVEVRIIIILLFLFSCSSVKKNEANQSVYKLIIDDIKRTEKFIVFKSNENEKCSDFFVSKYEFDFCSFDLFFKNKEIKELYRKNCGEFNFTTSENKNLNKLSDRGQSCFVAYFSKKINDKIIVEVISTKSEGEIGYKSLHFLYQIISSNNIKMIESNVVTYN